MSSSSAIAAESALYEGENAEKTKPSVQASYTLDLQTVLPNTTNVFNIIDVQFLHGYNQPTLMILHEPLKTQCGRIAVRKDTVRLDVLTLDVKERVSAFIWSKEALPFDAFEVLPVPMPIGGALVLSVNALFYLNQGVPPYGISLNHIGDATLENIQSKGNLFNVTDFIYKNFISTFQPKSNR